MRKILELQNISHSYPQGDGNRLHILQDVSFDIHAGEIVALMGRSGAGKSTLLHMAGLLDKPESGRIILDGKEITVFNDTTRTYLRQQAIGFVYQFHHLLPEFSALENVMLPQIAAKVPHAQAKQRAQEFLSSVRLDARMHHRPGQLSGGEQQRVAIARALANKPKLLLADEPTGNLDPETSEIVFEVLLNVIRKEGVGALIATHNPELAARMDRLLRLDRGTVVAA